MKVTSEIKQYLKEKDANVKNGREAMFDIMKDLHGQTMNELGKAALGSWDSYYLKKLLNTLEDRMAEYEGKATTELSGLLDSMWGKGTALVDAAFRAGELSVGGFRISTSALDALKDYSNGYLEKLFGDTWFQIKGEINLGMLGAKTPQDVAKAIGMTIDKGKFANIALRAETITQTEMGRIFSTATQSRMAEAAAYVEGIEKQWIHAGHPHMPRAFHVAAHGQHVPVDKPFMIGGIPIMHPRHTDAPIAEVIHCGCDHVPWKAEWEKESLIEGFGPYKEAFPVWLDDVIKKEKPEGRTATIGWIYPAISDWLNKKKIRLTSHEIVITDKKAFHAMNDAKMSRGAALDIDEFKRIPEMIDKPQAVLWDSEDPALLYVSPSGDKKAKVVVRINYKIKKEEKNVAVTAGKVYRENLTAKRYEIVTGEL